MNHYQSEWIERGLTCREVAERASEYLDERQSISTKIRFGLHVAVCSNCRAYLKQIALVRESIALLPRPCPSAVKRLRLHQHFAAFHAR